MEQWIVDAIFTGHYCDEYMCYSVRVLSENEETITLEFDPDTDECTEATQETFRKV